MTLGVSTSANVLRTADWSKDQHNCPEKVTRDFAVRAMGQGPSGFPTGGAGQGGGADKGQKDGKVSASD